MQWLSVSAETWSIVSCTSIGCLRYLHISPGLRVTRTGGNELPVGYEIQEAVLRFEVLLPGPVNLEIRNLLGQTVAVLADMYYDVGNHSVNWDASSNASGVYFYRLIAGDFVETKKMFLMK